ncbi:predicted protein [Histoplasma mississippiense (nom. inval.)]|uniref:predicted protein n=1 Tax=Ajellomyces capsulatus (strain NAm1 / WU24) TaxID=2059318 RepID=UPI000157BBB3|nr:predicted protein [Histoplasma mississippiense (nom. inval.)]EDN05612.1 predicted protein [Histoplasma mississippiense (nom. inval.)]
MARLKSPTSFCISLFLTLPPNESTPNLSLTLNPQIYVMSTDTIRLSRGRLGGWRTRRESATLPSMLINCAKRYSLPLMSAPQHSETPPLIVSKM